MMRTAISPRLAIKIFERKFTRHTQFAVYTALSLCKIERTLHLHQLTFHLQCIARKDLVFKLYLVKAGEIGGNLFSLLVLRQQNTAGLCHHFAQHHPGHHRISGKMSLQKPFFSGDGVASLAAGGSLLFSLLRANLCLVHQQHIVPVRQKAHDFLLIHFGIPSLPCYWMRNRVCPYSTTSPLAAQTSTISPSSSAVISFISFIASTMHSTSPFLTREPTSTKGLDCGEGAE